MPLAQGEQKDTFDNYCGDLANLAAAPHLSREVQPDVLISIGEKKAGPLLRPVASDTHPPSMEIL
jgi:hypothetical protein